MELLMDVTTTYMNWLILLVFSRLSCLLVI